MDEGVMGGTCSTLLASTSSYQSKFESWN